MSGSSPGDTIRQRDQDRISQDFRSVRRFIRSFAVHIISPQASAYGLSVKIRFLHQVLPHLDGNTIYVAFLPIFGSTLGGAFGSVSGNFI
jgi:hypothetical protein